MSDNVEKMRLSEQSVSYLNKLIRKDYIVEQQLYKNRDFNRKFSQSRSLSSSSSLASNPLNLYGHNQPTTWTYPLHGNGTNIEEQLAHDSNNVTQRQIIQICQSKANSNQNLSNVEQSVPNHLIHGVSERSVLSNPYYYSHVLISRLATQQILNHSIKGNEIEIMGILLGVTLNNKFIITRTFELPVEGTETRVNAQSESYEYMVQFVNELVENGEININERVVGWYHSHPGYDCWLSSIDMRTQDLNQSFQDPYVAVVVDPLKSLKDKTISIGAFRTIRDTTTLTGENTNISINDDQLTFYPLMMDIFDSNLNKCLDELKITFKFDINEHNHKKQMANKLTQSLLESMKQIRNINTMQKEINFDLTAGTNLENTNKNILNCQNFRSNINTTTSNSRHDNDMTPYNRSPCASSVSLNSLPNISDVEIMQNERDIDMESVNSSVYTGMGTSNGIDTTTSTTQQDIFRSPHYNTLLQQHLEQAVVGTSLLRNSTNSNNIQRTTSHRDSTSSHLDTTAVAIEKEHEFSAYINIKKTLLRLKMQEYKNLRLYRDAFTL